MILRAGVSAARVDDGLVLLDEASGTYWRLNPTATLVVGLLSAGHPCGDVARQVADRWNVEPAAAGRDVAALLDQLTQAGLIR